MGCVIATAPRAQGHPFPQLPVFLARCPAYPVLGNHWQVVSVDTITIVPSSLGSTTIQPHHCLNLG